MEFKNIGFSITANEFINNCDTDSKEILTAFLLFTNSMLKKYGHYQLNESNNKEEAMLFYLLYLSLNMDTNSKVKPILQSRISPNKLKKEFRLKDEVSSALSTKVGQDRLNISELSTLEDSNTSYELNFLFNNSKVYYNMKNRFFISSFSVERILYNSYINYFSKSPYNKLVNLFKLEKCMGEFLESAKEIENKTFMTSALNGIMKIPDNKVENSEIKRAVDEVFTLIKRTTQ